MKRSLEEAMRTVAALYVLKNGPYFGLEGVDPYDQERDARLYRGPYPVVAHPPCGPWGRYWFGGPSAKVRTKLGDDAGCFDRGLWAVRTFGGVLEHPAFSVAFKYHRIASPNPLGGWCSAGDGYGAWICQVHQGHYGHRADKATWLYAKIPRPLPELIWGPCEGKMRLDEGFHSNEERAAARAAGRKPLKRLSKTERAATPAQFKELLLSMARAA